jgi:Flp pilus assembly protein TadD
VARNQVVDQPAICGKCGAKVRADRRRCPRCREPLARPDPAAAARSSRKLAKIAAGICGVFVLVLAVLWVMREPAPAETAAGPLGDPLAVRRPPPAPPAAPVAAVPVTPIQDPMDRPFLEPSGSGAIAYASGNMEAALEQYLAAVEKNPNDAESLSNLGQVLVRLNRAEEALPYYRRAIALLPDRWTYQFNLARALGVLGRREESIAEYRRAQQLYPDDYATTFNLALALHKSGDAAAAVTEYQKAIALDPNEPTFRMALALSYERLQKPVEAAAAYEEAVRLAPDSPDAGRVKARIAQLRGGTPADPAAVPAPPDGPPSGLQAATGPAPPGRQ